MFNQLSDSQRVRPSINPDLLPKLSELVTAIRSTPLDLEELAETAYIESAHLMEMDFFQVGLFEEDRYRTVFWVRDGSRIENQEFLLADQIGLFSWIRNSGEDLLVADFDAQASDLPSQPSYPSANPPRSGLFVPLKVGEEVLGVISIQSNSVAAFDQENLEILNIIAQTLVGPIALSLLQEEIGFLRNRVSRDAEISSAFLTAGSLNDRITSALEATMLSFDYHSIHYYEVVDSQVEEIARLPSESDLPDHDQSLIDQVIEGHRPQINLRSLALASKDPDPTHLKSELCYPLLHDNHLLGILQVFQSPDRPFTSDQMTQIRMLAANITLATLESHKTIRQQEENWINAVLLEVARYAAQPGDTEAALQAVLQLTTMLTVTQWAALLVSERAGNTLRFGPSAGVSRQAQLMLSEERFDLSDLERQRSISQETPVVISLPESLSTLLKASTATALAIPSGSQTPNIFIIEESKISQRHHSLIVGIANQISLRLENYRLIEEVAAQQSLERELETARSIQESFLPRIVPKIEGWDLGVTWRVARQVGGDFYDFIPLDRDSSSKRWGIVIADVTDKGIPAALFMALCRTLLRSVAINRVDPGSTLTRLNQLLFADTQAELLVSLFYAVWEPGTSTLSYANAGHNPPLHFRPYQPAQIVKEHGMVLGATLDTSYKTYSTTLEQGEMVVLYTDGVTEANNTSGEMFGLHRLENLVLGMREWSGQAVTDHIAQRVADFCGTFEIPDDLTAIALYHTSSEMIETKEER